MPFDTVAEVINEVTTAHINPPITKTPAAIELEKGDWRGWLMSVFPFAFEDEFSKDHEKFWELFWSLLLRIKKQQEYLKFGLPCPEKYAIGENEWVILLILGRGLGKSATIEASAVMRGAILEGGYCLYICEAQDQAEEHIGNCKILIEHEESRLTEFYPRMAINENAVIDGMKLKDRTDLFITLCGWICRAKGLNSKLRGLRKGGKRPDDINIDDIDGVNDSVAVSLKKLKQLTSSVIPTQARRFSTIKFGQNLIAETSVQNQILTGKSDALSARTVVGVTNTFEKFIENEDYVSYLGEDGRVRWRILQTAVPTWSGVDLASAQKFLNDAGLFTFLAEYQNQFDHEKTEKVFFEYNEERQLIGWDDFERVMGYKYIPQHWNCGVGSDIGYSKQSLSAWAFVATSAQNSPLPSHYFLYRGLTFCQDSIDDQAERIWEELFPDFGIGKRHFEANQRFTQFPELFRLLQTKPRCAALLENYRFDESKKEFVLPRGIEDEEEKALFYVKSAEKTFESQIKMWRISHEKTGEQKTLAQKYGIPIYKTKKFGADAGAVEANNLLRGTYTKPHPFYEDEMVLDANGKPTGLYRLGCPYLFFIVEDKQKLTPINDNGLKVFREQISGQRNTPEKMTEAGLTKPIPMKFQADCGDALRMWAADYAQPSSAPLTNEEEFIEKIKREKPHLLESAINNEPDPGRRSQKWATLVQERQEFFDKKSRDYEQDNIFAQIYHEQGLDDDLSWMENL